MHLPRLAVVSFALLGASAAVHAQQGQDELWETTMSMESDGMKMPAMTQNVCTKKGASREDRMQMDKNCKILESKQSGTKFTYKFTCQEDNDVYSGTGEMDDLGKDGYKGKMSAAGTRKGEKFSMKMEMSGKRAGNCTYEDPSKKVAEMQGQQAAMMAKECNKQLADMEPAMFFPTEGMPPEMMMCKDRRGEFCANVTKVTQGMRDRAAYQAAVDKYRDKLDRAAKACSIDLAAARGPVCKSAVDQKDWQWLNRYCVAEAAALRAAHCAGQTYDSVGKQYADMCSVLGGLSYSSVPTDASKAQSGGQGAAAAGASTGGQAAGSTGADGKPAEPQKKPGTTEKIKETTDKLKKFLKF